MKILIICTGNSCRSQMAHGFLQSLDNRLEVYSAGTFATGKVSTRAIAVMKEAGVDINGHTSDHIDKYINDEWDYVITVCDSANETCPVFSGVMKHRIHIGFDDPYKATGNEDQIMDIFRRVRDEIRVAFTDLYENTLKNQLNNR